MQAASVWVHGYGLVAQSCHALSPKAERAALDDGNGKGKKKQTQKRVKNAEDQAWQRHSCDMRCKLGLTMDAHPWTGRPDVALRGVHRTPRVLDVIDIAWATRIHAPPEHVRQAPQAKRFELLTNNFFVNTSQQNLRKAWGELGTIATSTELYSFELDRAILPEELLSLQGHGHPRVGSLSAAEMRSVAGEGMMVPVLAAALYALMLEAPLPDLWENSPERMESQS